MILDWILISCWGRLTMVKCYFCCCCCSVLPVNIQDWFPLGLAGLISLQSKGLSNRTTVWKHQFFGTQPLWSSSHICTGFMLDNIFMLMSMLNSMCMLSFPHYYGGIGKLPPWLGFYFPSLLNLFMVISWFLLVE